MNRILIVEDESRISAFIEKGLQKNGFDTAIATDGEQALRMAESNSFDMLLLDLGLPIKDGWTVLQELRDRGTQIPIIIVSARDDIEGERAGLQNGATDYVTKPFRFQDLLQSVRSHLNNCTVY
jgi:two-component system, OmpR family, copper resistance phosphate regulon response regulator CusR